MKTHWLWWAAYLAFAAVVVALNGLLTAVWTQGFQGAWRVVPVAIGTTITVLLVRRMYRDWRDTERRVAR